MEIKDCRVPQVSPRTLFAVYGLFDFNDPVFYAGIRDRIESLGTDGQKLLDSMAEIIEDGNRSRAILSWYNKIATIVYHDQACTINELMSYNPGLFNIAKEKMILFSQNPRRRILWERAMLILYACIEAHDTATKALHMLNACLVKKVP